MKPVCLVYYATDSVAAKEKSASLRDLGKLAFLRQVTVYGGESEPCDLVVIMPDVVGSDRARIEAAYPGRVFEDSKIARVGQGPAIVATTEDMGDLAKSEDDMRPRRAKLSLPKRA